MKNRQVAWIIFSAGILLWLASWIRCKPYCYTNWWVVLTVAILLGIAIYINFFKKEKTD